MESSFIIEGGVPVSCVKVVSFSKWAADWYADAREIAGDSTTRRKKTAMRRFVELGFDKRFRLVEVPDSLHIKVECKNCGYVFTREISCLKSARSDKCRSANNIKCGNCGISANGTVGYMSTENTRGMDESVVVDYYLKGFSATQTAKKFGMNLRRVRRIIDEAGVARDRQIAMVFDDYPDVITGDEWLDEEFTCEECGRVFTRQQYMEATGRTSKLYKAPRFCSAKCRNRVNSRHSRHNRRKLVRASMGDVIPLGDLIERDGGICQICGEPVDIDDGFFDELGKFHTGPLYPTVDHVFPLSKGGTNTWDNVQLAHQSCNSGKCDKLPDELTA